MKQSNIKKIIFLSILLISLFSLLIYSEYRIEMKNLKVYFSGSSGYDATYKLINDNNLVCENKNQINKNGDTLILTCSNKYFSFLKEDKEFLVEGLSDVKYFESLINNKFSFNSDYLYIKEIDNTFSSYVIKKNKDNTYSSYLYENLYIKNDILIQDFDQSTSQSLQFSVKLEDIHASEINNYLKTITDKGFVEVK